MSDVFCVFLTPPSPPNPILSYLSTCSYFMMSYFDPQTPSPPTKKNFIYIQIYFYMRFPKLATFSNSWQKNYICICKKLRFCFKILWVKESRHCIVNSFLKKSSQTKYKPQQEYQNNSGILVQNMGCPIFAKLPTPLVLFCPILLDPPIPP